MRDNLVFLAATALFLVLMGTAGATAHDSHAAGAVATGHANIVVDASEVTGAIRSLQGINAGPRGNDRQSHLFCQYRDIGVDYVRIHDDAGSADMHTLFPDLAADPDDEASYHFVAADRELEAIRRVGARAVFRLGESSSSGVTVVPAADVTSWAQAAVHVARHYNDGWAGGFHWSITYWEVWNEPDISRFWTGTREEYFQLYEATARALKAYDPNLKVGGPAWCCDSTFFRDFLSYVRDHQVPLDFVSWHDYGAPADILARAHDVQTVLDTYGFAATENLLTEWNLTAHGEEGHVWDATNAAFSALVLSRLQDTSVRIANRYRGDAGLGMFSPEGFYYRPAYAFLGFHRLLQTPRRLATTGPDGDDWSALAGRDEAGTMVQVLISDFDSATTGFDLVIDNLPWGAGQPYHYERFLLDETHDLALVESAGVQAGSARFSATVALPAPSVQLIRLFIPAGEPSPRVRVHADQPLDTVDSLLYGLNHRYPHDGYGVWDAGAQRVHPEVIASSLEIGFPVARFPGGTVSSTYHWTGGIGPPGQRPTGILGFDGAPVDNAYGFDEHMSYMEQIGATSNVVVNFGTGTAQEAAAWVAYANGAVTDTRRIGADRLGVDWGSVDQWAARREANQVRLGMTPHPYAIEYWEVGNELYGDWERSWTHDPIEYAAGGTAWQSDQRLVKADDWRDSVSRSDGRPSQVFFVQYPPVVTGTQTVTVAGAAWTETPDLAVAGPDDMVYELDTLTGELRFGDGVHGRIPPAGASLRASYESGPHDGFADFYAAMKGIDPAIKVGSCFCSDTFLRIMGAEHPYDFLAVHPYYSSGDPEANLASTHLRTMAGPILERMNLEDLRAGVRLYAGERAPQVEIAVTEYNLVVPADRSPTPHYGMSLDQGLFVADMIRNLAELGVSLGNLHSLIDIHEGEGWANTPVLSPYPRLIARPAAYVLELFDQHVAPVAVVYETQDIPLLTGSVPALTVAASRDEDGQRLTLLAINKDRAAAIPATLIISGFTPAAEATVWTLSGPGITAFNDGDHPTDVITTETTITDAGAELTYAFPAHSVTLIELRASVARPPRRPRGRMTPAGRN
ncbi:MAG: hypothetical protein GXP47_00710 [Acidobacteria bacterium]|nr:hypothetical protein [Acidobacteriota bacterium]